MRRGLTLVEVLVIVVILIVGFALLIPGTGSHYGSSRRMMCLSNQKQLALAMQSFEVKHRQFPGFKQMLAGQEASWTVMLLPPLGRTDLWEKWEKGVSEKRLLNYMVCPSDPPESMSATDGPSSYAVNIKVCLDGKGLSWDHIKDGQGTTLLLSENLRADKAHDWWDTDPATVGFTDGPMKENVGSKHGGGVQAAFCDGSARFVRDDIDDALFKALVTPDGNEPVDEDKY